MLNTMRSSGRRSRLAPVIGATSGTSAASINGSATFVVGVPT